MRDIRQNLSRLNDRLSATIDRFEQRMAKTPLARSAAAADPPPPPLPPTKAHRPTRHRAALPVQYRRGKPPTALDRLRQREDVRRGGPTPLVASARRNAARVTDAMRGGLTKLHDQLAKLRASITPSRSAR